MENFEKVLLKEKNEFSKWFLYSVVGVLVLNILLAIISTYLGALFYVVSVWLFLGLLFLTLYLGYILYKSDFNFTSLFRTILILFFLFFTYLSLLLCKISETVFLYYFPIGALFLMLTSFRKTVFFVVFLMIFCYFMPDIGDVLHLSLDEGVYRGHENVLKIQEYMVIVVSLYFTFLILYYHFKFNEIKNRFQYKVERKKGETIEIESSATSHRNDDLVLDDKFQILYNRIILCFEREKPYINPDFSMQKLADLLDSNTAYISSALNRVGQRKFSQLVNEYRVNHVKMEIENDKERKFTIEYMYTQAGFSSQTTFNRVFKEFTGMTPKEYIEKL